MAMIQTIRNNSWILIIFIGLGLFAFLLMDMNGPAGGGAQGQNLLGKVNGEEIDRRKFDDAERMLYANSPNQFSAKQQLWDYFLQESLIKEEAETLGLGVGEEELESLTYGPDYSPFLRNQFRNPNTGQFDIQGLNNLRTQLENGELGQEQEAQWNQMVQFAKDERIQSKVLGMLEKSIYTPSWMVEDDFADQNTKFAMDYVKIPYSEIRGVESEVSDADIKNYLSQHRADYERDEETRVAKYVMYEIKATQQDSAALREELSTTRDEWLTTPNDSSFTLLQRGVYGTVYIKSDALDAEIRESLAAQESGTAVGPYLKNGSYKIVKLLDKKVLPDSVRVRHVMIQANPQDRASVIAANAQVDSLMEELRSGAIRFDTLANRVSQDASSNNQGGDLGYVASIPWSPEINNLAMYRAEEDELYKTYSRFGVHIVQVTDKKFINRDVGYRVASIAKPIVPSQQTQREASDKANNLVFSYRTLKELEAQVESDPEVRIETSDAKGPNDFTFGPLGESVTSRNIVKWMHDEDTKVGMVAENEFEYIDPTLYYTRYIIVPALSELRSPGVPTAAQARTSIEPILLNQRRAEAAKSSINGTLASVAQKYGGSVETLTDGSFGSSSLGTIGSEPKVQAALARLNEGETAVVAGESAIYYVKLNSKTAAPETSNIPQLRRLSQGGTRGTLTEAVVEAMKRDAKIEDNRATAF